MVVREIDIDALALKGGGHSSFEQGACLLEAVAYIAGEPWSDHPQCVSPVLGSFGRAWNDGMRSDEERASLKPYIPLLIGTAGDKEADERRTWMVTDWLVRVATPTWLRLAGLNENADALSALQPITNASYEAKAQGKISAARDNARAAAGTAAWADAGAEVRDSASAFVWADARASARAVAWAATWAAAGAYARANARAALEPTVLALQTSTHDLFKRMIAADEIPQTWPSLSW